MRMTRDLLQAATVAGLFGATLAALALPAAADINRGPYLQNLRQQSIEVVWEGAPFDAPRVGYGEVTTDESFVDAVCAGDHCWAKLGGLPPDSAYVYAVYSGDTPQSPDGSFHTAPSLPLPFSFVLYGDNRSDHVSHEMVVQSIEEDFAFIIHTGDMVGDGEVEADWDIFFDIEADLLRHHTIYGAIGNHEEEDGEAPIFERMFHVPSSESGSNDPFFYSYDYSNSRFIIIDGWVSVQPWYVCILMGKFHDNCLSAAQEAWVLATLKDAQADSWIKNVFVVMHEGPYSSKPGRTGSAAIRELLDEFATHKVKLVLSGHDHYFEHGISGNGVHYVISGGGGAPLYDNDPDFLSKVFPHQVIKAKSTHNYQVIDVEGEQITVTTYDVSQDKVLEKFTIGQAPDCILPEDCEGETPGTCSGTWTCPDNACVWECDPPPPCLTALDCPDGFDEVCTGHWECALPGLCQWICEGQPGECEADADCAGKEDLNACEGGHYQCADEVCEWVCEGPIPRTDEPDAGPDADDASDGDGPDDAGPTAPEDAGPPAPEDAAQPEDGGATDPAGDDAGPASPADAGGDPPAPVDAGPGQPQGDGADAAPGDGPADPASDAAGDEPGEVGSPDVDDGFGSGGASSDGCAGTTGQHGGLVWALLALALWRARLRRSAAEELPA